MAKYKAYPEYKDSGMEWCTALPLGWKRTNLRWLSSIYAGGTPSKNVIDYWENGTIPWINSGAVNQSYITEPSTFISKAAFENSSAKWIPKGALVVALAGQGKTKGMVAQLGINTTCNQSMAAIVFYEKKLSRYIYWWLTSNYQNIRNMAGGDLRDGLNLELLGDIQCPQPNDGECIRISAFLDHETAKIDNLIEKQQQLIELLKEKRQAVISSVVSIRSNVMKTKLKNLVSIQTGYPFSSTKFKFSPDNSIPLLRGVNVGVDCIKWDDVVYWDVCALDRLSDYLLAAGDIVFGMDRPWISSGARVSEIKEQDLPCLLLQRVARIRANIESYQPFIKLCLSSNEFREYAEIDLTGVSVPHISPEQISNFYVRDIPFDDQVYLAKKALEKIEKIEITQEMVEQTIQILQERRTALISAAVTGKIDVRDWVAPDTQDVEEPQEATA
ncbi:restriction endonuclease subunit S [Enterobacter asburiae]|uniref:restriction endonuclease subunit S n=1 Tax=Enterobacter asburiae TaxID=61645 RepID=UPI0020066DD3|nr:restriction endonuclease subunit S [Enterobacter asburiae]MCK6668605.1 restriction endonuclease subunit S [Enterobacter asburiae]